MAEKTLKTTILLRNDTSANWEAKDPILKEGEAGVDLTTGKIKIGNGTAKWTELKFVGGDAAQNFEVVPQEGEDDVTAITRVVGTNEIHNGDTAIVKRTISGDKLSYTAYVYDGAWKAMDGNYRADNVYFDDDITYTVAIGTLAKPSGSAKFTAKGKNVAQVLSTLMAQEANPSKTNPAVSFSTESGFGTFEIGTKKNLAYTATLSAGSYTYGPATGITAQTWEVTCTGVTGSKTTATGTFENVVAEAAAKTITAKANYNEGAVPVTNLGNSYPAGKITAGSASKVSKALTGVRYMFWGPMSDADAALNSVNIRALAHKQAVGTGALPTFGAGAGAKKVIVAVPAGRKITKVLLTSAMNADITSTFVKQTSTVSVEGAEGYTGTAYDVYVYQPASIDAGEQYAITIG